MPFIFESFAGYWSSPNLDPVFPSTALTYNFLAAGAGAGATGFTSTSNGIGALVVRTGDIGPADADGDGVADTADNCVETANTDQRDSDADGFGNVCDADLTGDCVVNAVDLGLFRAVFFTSDANADLDGNGVVNAIDLGILKVGFFLAPGPSGVPNGCDGG